MSVVFYKFKSAKDYDTCTFDGPHITVFDLKREILTAKKLGKGTDFDLAVYNAQTNEEFKDDMYHVPRNTSILVSRQPAIKPGKGTAQRYLASAMPTAAMTGGSRVVSTPMGAFSQASAAGMGVKHHSLNNRAPTDQAGAARAQEAAREEADQQRTEWRIANMFKLQTEQWDHAQDRMAMQKPIYRPYGGTRGSWRGRGGGAAGADQSSTNPDSTSSNGPNNHEHPQGGGGWHHHQQYPAKAPPPGYICYRCGQKGHFINQCPTIGDQTFDRPKLRRTTGIPKIFLKVVDDKTAAGGGVMVTQSGELVIAQPNDQAWADVAARNKNYIDAGDVYEMAPVPDELACPICKKLLRDAVLIPCCGTSYCDECIRTHLLDNEDPAQRLKCPNCHSDQSPDHLIPNKSLRQAVELHIKEFAS
ncbi:DWNN domain-containing protein, partial [Fimicolochytrium jonesii]|uniref:DWNN domain-containing protein n=1 Tax=Fimicolochytrium jonesii TaxID=1396493 RepID=UPI0022FF2C77